MSITIPIFPLNLVVFPKSRYPLHIFEERYKKMINRCIAENAGFGIVAVIENEPAKIGSLVIVSHVLQKYESGEMDIIVTSVGRFFIREIMLHPDGYSLAAIDEYNDKPESIDEKLLDDLRLKFEDIISKINFRLEESFWENYLSAASKSFKLAEKSGLSIQQQQELLTLQKENERIHFLLKHFEELDKKLSKDITMKNIIMNDGYINGEV